MDRDYYYEIGGTDDVTQLRHRRNIDSVQRMALQVGVSSTTNNREPQPKRRRISAVQPSSSAAMLDLSEQVDQNHNRPQQNSPATDGVHNHPQQISQQVTAFSEQLPFDIGTLPDLTTDVVDEFPPKVENKPGLVPLEDVLDRLEGKMTIFERDQLDKKNIEMHEITVTKMKAVTRAVEEQFLENPQLIGSIPNVPDQKASAFLCWLNHHKNEIKEDAAIRGNMDLVLTLFTSLKTVLNEWDEFLDRWRLRRILLDDDFAAVWKAVKDDLQLSNDPIVPYDESKSDILPDARPSIQAVQQDSDKDELD